MQHFEHLPETPIDLASTLSQLLNKFATIRHGLPELIKNSKDQYSRLGITDRPSRQILVLAHVGDHRLGVLDFAGADLKDFTAWMKWSDRKANRRELAEDIEGGNGNGGKGFMCHGSRTIATFESCANGRFTRMAFTNNDESHRFVPAYALGASGERLRNVEVADPEQLLSDALSGFSASLANLPNEIAALFRRRQAFTLVQLEDVRVWHRRQCEEVRRRLADIPGELGVHPQAALTLETCDVRLAVDGRVSPDAIAPQELEPFPGYESLPALPIPDMLVDPSSNEEVDTGPGDESTKTLQLRTSHQPLRMENKRPLNVVRVSNGRNIVANWTVADLFSRAESAFIYGKLSLPAFADSEHLSGADRDSLADTPLVRAVRHWVSNQVEHLAHQIQEVIAQEHTQEDRSNANDTLNKLRDLMREFLDSDFAGDEGQGTGGPGGNGDGNGRRRGTRVDEIVVENEAEAIGVAAGTTVPLVVRGFEVEPDGRRLWVPGAALQFCASNTDCFKFEDGLLTAMQAGDGEIWFTCADTDARSSDLAVTAIKCNGASISGVPDRLLLQGERVPLRIQLHTDSESRSDFLLDAVIDEINMGNVSRTGVYTAGGREGNVTVRVRYGPGNEDTASAVLSIGPERVRRRESHPRLRDGGGANADLPYILLCGTPVPGTEDRQPQFRTIHASRYEPTIIDFEPEFENAIFINPDSREATQVRARRGGRRGSAGIGTQTFGQFLALKCFEILKRLKVFQENAGASLDSRHFREAFAEAELDCAPFIERAYELGREIAEEHARRENA